MTEPIWVDEAAVLAMHDLSLASHGGAPGIRDINLLLSALARPRQHFVYAGMTQANWFYRWRRLPAS